MRKGWEGWEEGLGKCRHIKEKMDEIKEKNVKRQNHALLIEGRILHFTAIASIGMSCLLTDADKASLNPIYYKVERQLSKGFHFRYRISSVQISLNAFVGENAAFQNSLPCCVADFFLCLHTSKEQHAQWSRAASKSEAVLMLEHITI